MYDRHNKEVRCNGSITCIFRPNNGLLYLDSCAGGLITASQAAVGLLHQRCRLVRGPPWHPSTIPPLRLAPSRRRAILVTTARSGRRLRQIRDRHPVWAMEGVRETQQARRVRNGFAAWQMLCCRAKAAAADANHVFVGEASATTKG